MTAPKESARGQPVIGQVIGWAVAFVACLGIWLGLAGAADLQDVVGGSVTAIAAVAVGRVLAGRTGLELALYRADFKRLASVVPQVLTDTWKVFGVVVKQISGRGADTGVWLTTDVADPKGTHGRLSSGRIALLTGLMSASPNTIVVAMDADGQTLVHMLVATGAQLDATRADSGSLSSSDGERK